MAETGDIPVNTDREAELTRRQSESLRKQKEAFDSFDDEGTTSPVAPSFGMGMGGGSLGQIGGANDPPPFGAFSSLIVAEAQVEAQKDKEDDPPMLACSLSDDTEVREAAEAVAAEARGEGAEEADGDEVPGYFSPPPDLEDSEELGQ